MPWSKEPLTGGVVTTRNERLLAAGELVRASNCRLMPGDLDQLYAAHGLSPVLPDDIGLSGGSIVGMDYANFEGRGEYLIVLYTDGFQAPLQSLVIAVRLSDQTYFPIWFGPQSFTRGALVHRGNEYFLGTDSVNLVLTAPVDTVSATEDGYPTAREQGLEATTGQPILELSLPSFRTGITLSTNPRVGDLLNKLFPNNEYNTDTAFRAEVNYAFERLSGGLDMNDVRLWTVSDVKLDLPAACAFVYWLSEYASDIDVQAAGATPQYAVFGPEAGATWSIRFVGDGQGPFVAAVPLSKSQREQLGIDVDWSAAVRANTLADKWRLYRANAGPVSNFQIQFETNLPDVGGTTLTSYDADSDGISRAKSYVAGETALVGGLLDEFALDVTIFEDRFAETGILDLPIQYPLVVATGRGLTKLDPYLRKPNPWVAGALFGDALVVVDATQRQTLYYSYPGDPENQPRSVYRELLVTDKADEVMRIIYMRDRVFLVTKGGLHALNYLPYEGEVFRDRVQERVLRRHGCVGVHAVDTVETEFGEMLVWLSPYGLMASDGVQWRDVCRDFSVETALPAGADLEGAVVLNDPQQFAVLLFVPFTDSGYQYTQQWTFYYHPTLLKDGGFRALGPTTFEGKVKAGARGSVDGEERAWIAVDVGNRLRLLRVNDGPPLGPATIVTRTLSAALPFATQRVTRVALQLEAGDGVSIQHVAEQQSRGKAAQTSLTTWLEDADIGPVAMKHFVGQSGIQGDFVRHTFTVAGQGWSVGPLWRDVDPGAGADVSPQ